MSFFFFQAEDGIRDIGVTGVQTCALPICAEDVLPLADDEVVLPAVTSTAEQQQVAAHLELTRRVARRRLDVGDEPPRQRRRVLGPADVRAELPNAQAEACARLVEVADLLAQVGVADTPGDTDGRE